MADCTRALRVGGSTRSVAGSGEKRGEREREVDKAREMAMLGWFDDRWSGDRLDRRGYN